MDDLKKIMDLLDIGRIYWAEGYDDEPEHFVVFMKSLIKQHGESWLKEHRTGVLNKWLEIREENLKLFRKVRQRKKDEFRT